VIFKVQPPFEGVRVTVLSKAQRRVLTTDCLACNREAWQPMCELCDDLEAAEERAAEHDEPRGRNDGD